MRPRALSVLRCEDEGGWVACLAVVPVRGRRDVLGPGLASWHHEYSFLGTPLLASGAEQEGARGLLGLVGARRRTGFLALDWVRSGPAGKALRSAGASAVVADQFERAFVFRPEPGASPGSPLSAKRAKELRRHQRRLAEALGGSPEIAERTGDPRAPADFLALEGSGWKGRAATAMAARPGHGPFFTAICEAFARRGALQILSLEARGRRAAMQCNLRAGEGLFCFKVAYDEGLGLHSPGAQLEVGALEQFAGDEQARWMDSCAAPDAELINRLWPDRTTLNTLIIPADGAWAPATRSSAAVLGAVRRARPS
jgi:CelD/BcsL family acetyltransferase involved in cellulose biosynthesis